MKTGIAQSTSLLAAALIVLTCATADRCQAQVRVDVDAVSGAPFGVGRITLQSGNEFRVNIPPRAPGGPRGGRIADIAKKVIEQGVKAPPPNLEMAEMSLVEKSSRVLYPVFEKRDRPVLREFVTMPTQTTIFFLFRGDGPLELTSFAPQPQVGRVTPRKDPAAHAQLLQAWWRDFSAAADARSAVKDFPPLVEEYLVDTLSRRLRLPLPERVAATSSNIFQSELNLLMGTEAARQELTRSILTADAKPQLASEPLPEELPQPKPELLNPAEADVEPLAMHVPLECLYVRFGSFSNFLWLRHRLDEWGGELRDIVSERGLDYNLNDRMQRQMGLRESALAELLGERVIADVALIGADMFLNEGAAIGMLFQAKNSTALAADLTQQRLTALKEAKHGKQEKLTVADHPVSFFSTPDNSLRSFYVSDGDFHLVTTSRTMVEWFLATGAGKHDSLGASEEFRLARKHMPLARNDTLFVYLSPAFFQNLLSPHYQIELDRRLRSAVEIELFQIAQLSARAEQKQATTIGELVAAGFLPEGFGERSDGSRLEMAAAEPFDSLRGGRGTFLPIPDVRIEKVTAAESAKYRQFSADYVTQWGSMDPVVAGVRREALPGGKLERVVLDLQAAPLAQRHADMLAQWLGPPTDQRLAPVPGDVVAFDAVMRGGSATSGDHHLFGALRDADPSIAMDLRTSLIMRLFASQLEGLQGYLGAWPDPGLLRILSGWRDVPADGAGYSRLLTGLTRRQFNNFTLLSFQPEVLAKISPQLRFEKAERPAQVWIRADDLSKSKIAPLLNAYGYRQSRQIVLGNSRYMNMLIEQLHVPAPDARAVAERLLHAKLLDPLGGQYELREPSPGQKAWTSTSLANASNSKEPPADYQFPALNWFRGIQLELTSESGLLAVHGEVIMPGETKTGFQLPGLNLTGQKPAASPPKPAATSKNATPPKPAAAPRLPKSPSRCRRQRPKRQASGSSKAPGESMKGRLTACGCMALAIVLGSASTAHAAAKLNVLLIAVDDLNNDLGCYGHRIVQSPAIDRLAARGVRFDRAYCQFPLCNPSRVSMLSGRRPDATGIMDLQTPPRTHLKDVVFLPQYFRRQGYFAGHVGKIFHTGPAFEDPPSWDTEIRETGKVPPKSAVIREQTIERPQKYHVEWAVLNSSDAETADGVVARQGSEMLQQRAAADKPFFLAIGFRRPHAPYAAPRKYFDLYPPDHIGPLAEPPDHLRAIPAAALTYPAGTRPISESERQEAVAAYYACISFVDAQIALVLDTLDRLDLWKNTVVVFYSDHGYQLGEHGGLWHKMSLFEQSARVPMIVAAPGTLTAGQSCAALVELLDVYPTLVDLCGLPGDPSLEGKSLRPLLDNPKGQVKNVAFTQVRRDNVMGQSVMGRSAAHDPLALHRVGCGTRGSRAVRPRHRYRRSCEPGRRTQAGVGTITAEPALATAGKAGGPRREVSGAFQRGERLGTVPILRSPRSKMGLSPSPRRSSSGWNGRHRHRLRRHHFAVAKLFFPEGELRVAVAKREHGVGQRAAVADARMHAHQHGAVVTAFNIPGFKRVQGRSVQQRVWRLREPLSIFGLPRGVTPIVAPARGVTVYCA